MEQSSGHGTHLPSPEKDHRHEPHCVRGFARSITAALTIAVMGFCGATLISPAQATPGLQETRMGGVASYIPPSPMCCGAGILMLAGIGIFVLSRQQSSKREQ